MGLLSHWLVFVVSFTAGAMLSENSKSDDWLGPFLIFIIVGTLATLAVYGGFKAMFG